MSTDPNAIRCAELAEEVNRLREQLAAATQPVPVARQADPAAAIAPASCPCCGAGPTVCAPGCALGDAKANRALVLDAITQLRAIDAHTCTTFDGHAVRALLQQLEAGVRA